MASLKQDLTEVTTLLEEKPVDSGTILRTMHEREQQTEQLQCNLPKLGLLDTKRIQKKVGTLSNDHLSISFHQTICAHNDLNKYMKHAR